MKIIFLGLILALAIADAGRLLNPCKQPGFFAHVDNTSAFYGCYLNEDGNLDVKYLTCATGHLFKRTAGYCVPKTTFAIEARAVTDSNNDVENPTEPTTTTKGDIIKPTIPTTAATGSTINGNTKVDNNDDGETTEGSTEATTTVETTEATEQPETTENSTETTEEPATTDETTVVSTEEPATTEETTETTDEPATTASTTETTEEPTTTASTTEEPTTTDEPTTTA
ncbi:PREDICTED: integumentary mucin A.1-like, partial [Rhagoletis zephyria]|uniref:integumentary mucin A.1-like n=1 Tax=Rhagoletis zephyria TaxID=28612 RepID=UPI00081147C6